MFSNVPSIGKFIVVGSSASSCVPALSAISQVLQVLQRFVAFSCLQPLYLLTLIKQIEWQQFTPDCKYAHPWMRLVM